MTTFTHQNTTITLLADGTFEFKDTNGIVKKAASLSAAKKRIDAQVTKEFKSFTVLENSPYAGHKEDVVLQIKASGQTGHYRTEESHWLRRHTIITVKEKKTRYSGVNTLYIDQRGNEHEPRAMLADTPETIAAWKAWAEADLAEGVRHYTEEQRLRTLKGALPSHVQNK